MRSARIIGSVRKKRAVKLEDFEDKKPKRIDVKQEEPSLDSICESVKTAKALLEEQYGKVRKLSQGNAENACGRKEFVLDALIHIILSQNTSDLNSSRAMRSLQDAFSTSNERSVGEEISKSRSVEEIEEAIRCGGLSKVKSKRIKALVDRVVEKYGKPSLEHFRNLTTADIKQELLDLKASGIGPKTTSCLLLFTLNREDFPVDTHVHRVTTRLGWNRTAAKLLNHPSARKKNGGSPSDTYELMNKVIPGSIMYDAHILLIEHGRSVCKARTPNCNICPLATMCSYFNEQKFSNEF